MGHHSFCGQLFPPLSISSEKMITELKYFLNDLSQSLQSAHIKISLVFSAFLRSSNTLLCSQVVLIYSLCSKYPQPDQILLQLMPTFHCPLRSVLKISTLQIHTLNLKSMLNKKCFPKIFQCLLRQLDDQGFIFPPPPSINNSISKVPSECYHFKTDQFF